MPKPIKSPEGKAFVEDVRLAVGAETIRELSRMLGYHGTDREGRLYAWARGETAPNHEGTLDLLRIAGRLREPSEAQPLVPQGRSDSQGDTLGAVAAVVKEMRAGFRKIDRRLQALEQQRTSEAPQSPATADGGS